MGWSSAAPSRAKKLPKISRQTAKIFYRFDMTTEGWRLVLAAALGLWASGGKINAATNISHRFDPVLRPFTEERFHSLKVPPGFRINVFAAGQGNARMMLLLPDGTILLTRYDIGQVTAMRDTNGDGVADATPVVANIPHVHG
jgi:hypothetical protein